MEEIKIAYFFDGPIIPPTESASNRALNLCKYLAKDFPVYMIKCWREVDTLSKFKIFTKGFPNLKFSLVSPNIYYKQPSKALNIIEREKIDVIISKDPEMILSTFLFIRERRNIKVVFDAHDVGYHLLGQIEKDKLKIAFEKVKELMSHYYSNLHFCVSKIDLERFLLIGCKKEKMRIVRNGVDCKEIKFFGPNMEAKTVLFLGHMHYFPNLDAVKLICERIVPKILKERKDITFLFIGAVPKILTKYKNLNVKFTGPVENLNKIFNNVSLAIAPLRYGTGTQIKILHYLGAGIPTLATNVAIEGLEGTRGIITENRIENYPERILSLLEDEKLLKRLGKTGRKSVERGYDWSLISKQAKKYIIENFG